jgi:hypothetical protein
MCCLVYFKRYAQLAGKQSEDGENEFERRGESPRETILFSPADNCVAKLSPACPGKEARRGYAPTDLQVLFFIARSY